MFQGSLDTSSAVPKLVRSWCAPESENHNNKGPGEVQRNKRVNRPVRARAVPFCLWPFSPPGEAGHCSRRLRAHRHKKYPEAHRYQSQSVEIEAIYDPNYPFRMPAVSLPLAHLKLLHRLFGLDSSQNLVLAQGPLKELLVSQNESHLAIARNVDRHCKLLHLSPRSPGTQHTFLL